MIVSKKAYKADILRELFVEESLSSTDLFKRIGRSLSLTTKMLSDMLEEGVIVENGLAPSSGGRRPLMYSLKPDSFYLVGVAMDQFVSRITIIDARREFVVPITEIELSLSENTEALNILAQEIKNVIENTPINKDKIIGIGIGMPGFINPKKGINYTFLGTNICNNIQSKTGIPVFIENDSSAIALAESKLGIAKGERNSMVLNISWGVGLGMIIDSKLFRGEEGFAGEFSHIPLFKNGKLCSCGKTGCLETETSLLYMLAKMEEKIKSGRASYFERSLGKDYNHEQLWKGFIEAAQRGDSLSVEVISDAGYNVGQGIAILIHLLNPSKIIISGRCAAAGKIWLAPIERAINEFCIPKLVRNIKVEISNLGHNAEIIGAGLLVMENIKYASLGKL